jgi:hypothetical protein
MQIKKLLWVLAACVMLTGCPGTLPVAPPATISHPALPSPVGKYKLKWKVIPQGDHVYVALTYDESLQLKLMIEDLLRYSRESNSVMCYYRRELAEPRCLTIEKPVPDTK